MSDDSGTAGFDTIRSYGSETLAVMLYFGTPSVASIAELGNCGLMKPTQPDSIGVVSADSAA